MEILSNQSYNKLEPTPVFWSGFPVVSGKVVFIKPNLVTPKNKWDCCSTTERSVVELVIQKCLDEGAGRIIIGECGFKDQWEATIRSTGYFLLPKKYDKVELIPLQDGENFHKFTLIRNDDYLSLYGVKFSDYLLNSDVVINLPKMKVHTMALMTGAIKNMMGTMAQKGSMHPKGDLIIIQKRLADFYKLTKNIVDYVVMDGIEGVEFSEQYGRPVSSKVLLSGTDQWEIDVAASKLMGIDPSKVGYLKYINRNFDQVSVPGSLVKNYELPLKWSK